MGKRQKIKAFSFQGFDNVHYKATTAYANVVSRLFDKATEDVAHMVIEVKVDPNKPFVFDDYPKAKKAMSKIVAKLTEQMKAVVEAGASNNGFFQTKRMMLLSRLYSTQPNSQKHVCKRYKTEILMHCKHFNNAK